MHIFERQSFFSSSTRAAAAAHKINSIIIVCMVIERNVCGFGSKGNDAATAAVGSQKYLYHSLRLLSLD